MKKIILSLLCELAIKMAIAQVCVPDTSIAQPGINPDSAAGIAQAHVDSAYYQHITVVVPADTMIDPYGSGNYVKVIFDSILLTGVLDKPAWLQVNCEPPSCGFPGDSSGCIVLSGMPQQGDAGIHHIDFILTSYGKIQGLSQQLTQVDTLYDYYTLEVSSSTGIPFTEENHFRIYPVPAKEGFWLEFPRSIGAVHLQISNIRGQLMWSATLQSGHNPLWFELKDLPPGIYLVKIYSKDHAVFEQKKILVR